jgi:hypothetical protein
MPDTTLEQIRDNLDAINANLTNARRMRATRANPPDLGPRQEVDSRAEHVECFDARRIGDADNDFGGEL